MKLVICSTNRRKYSETFIHGHYELLGKGDLLLADGYLPTSYSRDGGETFASIQRTRFTTWLPTKNEGAQEAVARLLKKNRIGLVLAEYGPAGVEMLPICQRLGIPLIVHFHGYDAYRDDVLGSYGTSYTVLFQYASKVIAVSRHMARQLERLGCDPSKVVHVPYGIDTRLFAPSGKKQAGIQIACCGRFVKKKAPDLILRAFEKIHRQIPEARLVMIGEGELLESCQTLASKLNLRESTDFTGVLPPRKVADVLRSSHLFLQHSMQTDDRDSEGTPLSILEAMATGLPVVATRHAGIPEIVEHGRSGMLVEEGNWKAMAEETVRILQHSTRMEQLGQAAQAYAVRHHEKGQTLELLQRILMENAL